MEISNETLLRIYRKLKEIRFFEEKIKELYQRNLVQGAAHLSIGEEAIAVGVCENLDNDDHILTTHRGHGHCLAKGAEPKYMFAELLGKYEGYCKGKGGSMHISDYSSGILCANGIVGGGLPISVGAGLSKKQRKDPGIIVCFFGDGAVCQGSFHESLNMAAVWELPILYVCENNRFAISTRTSYSIAPDSISDFASGYGITSKTINGNNVLDVYSTVKEMKGEILEKGGPAFIQADTYRLAGHYIGDDQKYREREETNDMWKEEPVAVFEDWLSKNRKELFSELTEIEQEVRDLIDTAADFAVKGTMPPLETALSDVFNKTGQAWERRQVCEKDYSTPSN